MLVLTRQPETPTAGPNLRFEKPGPETGRHQAGLPPAPSGGPAESPAGGPLGGTPALHRPAAPTSEPPPPAPPQRPSRREGALQAPPTSPFTDSLERIGKGEVPSGSGGGTGSGAPGTAGRPGKLSGDASFAYDSGGFDLSEWAELVKLKVKSNWIIPTAAYMGMKGVVSIELVVELNGVISKADIVSSSGIPSMDTAAMNALRSSSPLPALPRGFPKAKLQAQFAFFYNTYPSQD